MSSTSNTTIVNRGLITIPSRYPLDMNTDEPVPAIDHYDNGQIRFRGANLGGEMHGAWEFFRKDGSLLRSGEFDRGRQVGPGGPSTARAGS